MQHVATRCGHTIVSGTVAASPDTAAKATGTLLYSFAQSRRLPARWLVSKLEAAGGRFPVRHPIMRNVSRRVPIPAVPAAALAMLTAISSLLTGCSEPLLGASAHLGVAMAEERPVAETVDDLKIRVQLNHIFFNNDIELHRAVSFSVIEGRTLLTGIVPAFEDRIRAVRLARKAEGVHQVIDGLQVAEKGGVIDYALDRWITARLKLRILTDKDILHINYDINTVNRTVYLFGIAQDEEELAKAMGHARFIGGVKNIVSHVIMKNDPRRPGLDIAKLPPRGAPPAVPSGDYENPLTASCPGAGVDCSLPIALRAPLAY